MRPGLRAARLLSIIGHPALLMPAAVVGASLARQAPAAVLHVAAAASVFVAVCVGLYSVVQVRAGRWRHVDASVPAERSQLNQFLALLLFGTAGVLWGIGQPRPVSLGLALGGALVVFGHLLRRRCKVSLHAGFAVFAAGLLWPGVAAAAGLALAAGVGWSRLALRRHTRAEVVLGLLAGGVAAVAFHAGAG